MLVHSVMILGWEMVTFDYLPGWSSSELVRLCLEDGLRLGHSTNAKEEIALTLFKSPEV